VKENVFVILYLMHDLIGCEDPLCMECNSPNRNECLKCEEIVDGIIYDPTHKICTCKAGMYRDGNGCLPCHILCSECTGPTNQDCLPKKCKDKAYAIDYLQTTCLYMCRTPMDDLYIDTAERVCKRILILIFLFKKLVYPLADHVLMEIQNLVQVVKIIGYCLVQFV